MSELYLVHDDGYRETITEDLAQVMEFNPLLVVDLVEMAVLDRKRKLAKKVDAQEFSLWTSLGGL